MQDHESLPFKNSNTLPAVFGGILLRYIFANGTELHLYMHELFRPDIHKLLQIAIEVHGSYRDAAPGEVAVSSPQSRGARRRSAMTKQQEKGLTIPTNFVLGASDTDLDNFELARLAEQSDCTAQAYEFLERAIDCAAQARVIRWFRSQDRQTLKRALENEETAEEWAKRMIRDRQRSPEELLPRPSLPPGAAHLAAAVRYQERQISKGLCSICPEPLDANSVRYCTKHLAATRTKSARQRGVKGEPGSADYLYGEITESQHGRTPGTPASLEMNNEKATRRVLAEFGIPPDSAAVSLKAAIEALLKTMPHSRADAMTQAQLFEMAGVVTKTKGQRALKALLSEARFSVLAKAVCATFTATSNETLEAGEGFKLARGEALSERGNRWRFPFFV